MALVGYSDSEGSDAKDEPVKDARPAKPAEKPSKSGFQKLIDRSNPHKIRVSLAEDSKPGEPGPDDQEERPGKHARLDREGSSGFNALLPAPKRAGPAAAANASNGARKGLGSGVSLKTGAAPGFSREPAEASYDQELPAAKPPQEPSHHDPEEKPAESHGLEGVPKPKHQEARPDPPKVGNSMMFKPLSVAKKPQKKKAIPPKESKAASPPKTSHGQPDGASKAPAKISLFSMGDSEESPTNGAASRTAPQAYQPFYKQISTAQEDAEDPGPAFEQDPSSKAAAPDSAPAQGKSLAALASSLNLTPAQRRQLFGRGGAGAQNASVITADVEAEYEANEQLRAAAAAGSGGAQQPPHNPVRSIAPGKHSLKQLVNAVAGQRDALEESFAAGKRNKKEAGSKYGW